MKNPNRYGSITKLKGNRRRPWMIREGLTGESRVIGYADTREEAMILLAEYNRLPWDSDARSSTVKEVYEAYIQYESPHLNPQTVAQLRASYNYISRLNKMRYASLKTIHMQSCIDQCDRGGGTKNQIRNLWRRLDQFASDNDIIDKKRSDGLKSAPVETAVRSVFSQEEIARLWENVSVPFADAALILLYTGFRANELLTLDRDHIDLDEKTMRGGEKTDAGKNRVVPIHPKIEPLIRARLEASRSGCLIEEDGEPITYDAFYRRFGHLMDVLGMKHIPHEARHTFRSALDSAGANKVCIDRIMGHVSPGTGDKIYTHKKLDELRAAIEKLAY